jgi:hypothetical protein
VSILVKPLTLVWTKFTGGSCSMLGNSQATLKLCPIADRGGQWKTATSDAEQVATDHFA